MKKPIGHSNDSGKFKVRQSSVKLWRKCHYAYWLRYGQRLRKRVPSRSLQFGTIVHELFDAYAEGEEPMDKLKQIAKDNAKLFRSAKEEYGDIVEDVRQIMTTYFDYYDEKELRYIRINGRSSEHKFEIDLDEVPGAILTGKIDGFGRTPNKLQWMIEHKTFKRTPSEDQYWRNVQSSVYIKVTDILGWVKGGIEGMVWDYIHNKPPTRPAILKGSRGKNVPQISRAKINTLPITVEEMIAELGADQRQYTEFLKGVDENLASWFFRIHTPVDPVVVDHIWDDFLSTVQQMMDFSHKLKDKTIEQHCGWCDFEPICRAELQGDDVDYVIERQYYVHEGDEYETSLTDSST